MKTKFWALVIAALVVAGGGSYITAQQSGSGIPGGASFSTQYKLNPTTFGGAGPGAAGTVLTSNGAGAAPTYQAGSSVTPAALTRTSDTNVTLTLGGTPTTALLQATSITAGWTGTLAHGRGGTDNTSAADDNVLVGDGTNWVTKALTSCSAASSAVTYNTTTNSWGCNTISGGVAQSTGTFTVNWTDACTTTPTQTWTYVLTGTQVTLAMTQGVSCTSDSTNFISTAGDVPVAIRPTNTVVLPATRAADNSVAGIACVAISSAGTMSVQWTGTYCQGSGVWTAANVKQLNTSLIGPTSFSYITNN